MVKVTLGGKEWPLLFDLNAIDEMQKRYGDVQDLFEQLIEAGEMRWVLAVLIREGVAAQNDEEGTHITAPTEDQMGRMMTLADLQSAEVAQAVLEAFAESLGKNVTGAELTEFAKELAKAAASLTASRPKPKTTA